MKTTTAALIKKHGLAHGYGGALDDACGPGGKLEPVICDEFTNPVAASTTGLLAATLTTVAVQTILAAALIAGGKTALAAFPRNLTFTTGGTATDAPNTVTVTGLDVDGNVLVETLALSQAAGTDVGVKAFASVASVVYGAGVGPAGTVAIGFGQKFGLSKSIKQRAGRPAVLQEVAVAVVVTTGTMVSAATSPPHGTYSPATAPDGAKSYAVTYEQSIV